MKTFKITILLLAVMSLQAKAQQHAEYIKQTVHTENSDKHHDGRGFRVAGVIGHTLVNTEGLDNVFVPSWGLDFEYWFNHSWGI